MLTIGDRWLRVHGASDEDLRALASSIDVKLPPEYLDLLAVSNGGEGPLATSPFNLCLYSATEAKLAWADGQYREFFPGFFVFGGSGGGDYIAFDLRSNEPPWPVVAIDMTNIDLSESVETISSDFSSFLSLVGVRRPDA